MAGMFIVCWRAINWSISQPFYKKDATLNVCSNFSLNFGPGLVQSFQAIEASMFRSMKVSAVFKEGFGWIFRAKFWAKEWVIKH